MHTAAYTHPACKHTPPQPGQCCFSSHTHLLQPLWKLYPPHAPLAWMWGNCFPVPCAPKSPDPFSWSTSAQSKHLSNKPFTIWFLRLSFSPCQCLEKVLNTPLLGGWLNAEVGSSCLGPPRLVSQEAAHTSAPLNQLTDLERSLFRATQRLNTQHTAMLEPQQPPPAEARHRKVCFLHIWPVLESSIWI